MRCLGKLGRKLLEFCDEFSDRSEREPGHRPVGVANNAISVDDKHTAPRKPDGAECPVGTGNGFVNIRQQRKREAVLVGEAGACTTGGGTHFPLALRASNGGARIGWGGGGGEGGEGGGFGGGDGPGAGVQTS